MESLLVHSDGECAVVLVIDADHSSLGKQKERRGERENGKSRQSDRDTSYSTFHFDLRALNMSPTGSHLLINPSHSQQLTLFSSKAQFPVASSSFSSKTKINHRLSLSLSQTHKNECSLLEHGREEGRGGGGIWESEGGERQGRVEREKKYTREQQPKRKKGTAEERPAGWLGH